MGRPSSELREYKGESRSLVAWAIQFGINPETLKKRLYKFKWLLEKALTKPVQAKATDVEINGIDQKDWLAYLNITRQALHMTVKKRNLTLIEEL